MTAPVGDMYPSVCQIGDLPLMLSPLPLLYLSSFMAFTSSIVSSANVSTYTASNMSKIRAKLMAGLLYVYTEVIYS